MSFASLPQDCIANITSLTSPKDACVAAAVSLGFKSVFESDAVWMRYLPSDYKDIIGRSSSSSEFQLDRVSSLKERYFKLCNNPILLDGGKLSFRLIKTTGKKCYMLCARELSIAWKDDPRFWLWTSSPDSRFTEIAQLDAVCWLDIAGTFQASKLSPDTNYAAYLVFKTTDNNYGLDECSNALVDFVDDDIIMENNDTQEEVKSAYIVRPPRRPRSAARRGRVRPPIPIIGEMPRARTDGWHELKLGEIFVGQDEKHEIRFRLYETERLHWKGGLIVDGVELRPKE